MRASVYIATSVDGFIAREDGSVDWLPSGEDAASGELGYQAFFDSVDGLVMGSNTYELLRSFSAWPYGRKPVVVLSSRELDIPEEISRTVSLMNGTPAEVIEQLIERGHKHLYIDGGKTIQGFLREGLIQTLVITKIPILIGSGIPLFGALPGDLKLKHMGTESFEGGFVQSRYEVSHENAKEAAG